jgi:hypothetical protein
VKPKLGAVPQSGGGFLWMRPPPATFEEVKMGAGYPDRNSQLLHQARMRELNKKKDRDRAELAARIVMVIVDRVCADIIRPGPTPEERECYVVAQELRDIAPELEGLVAGVLKVAAEEPRKPGHPVDAPAPPA